MQLVAYGAQDIYLTGNPQITFFKVVYRRHTNFSMESIEQTLNGETGDEKRAVCTLSRNGDLVSNMWLEHHAKFDAGRYLAQNSNIGTAILKKVEIEIGGQIIDTHTNEWLNCYHELHDKNNSGVNGLAPLNGGGYNYNGVEKNIDITGLNSGNFRSNAEAFREVNHVFPTGPGITDAFLTRQDVETQYPLITKEQRAYGLGMMGLGLNVVEDELRFSSPFRFWFCKNPGLALPLIALQYHEVKINIEFSKRMYASIVGLTHQTGHIKSKLWADYIYLDTDERRRFSQVSHEYLIEQTQMMTEEIDIGTTNAPSRYGEIKLKFNHPVKELIWQFKNSGNLDDRAFGIKYFNTQSGETGYAQEAANGQANLQSHDTVGYPIEGKFGLKLNGQDRFKPQNHRYFTRWQIMNHHSGYGGVINPDSISVYSFALKPEEHQPSGTCNFSRIDSAELTYENLRVGMLTQADDNEDNYARINIVKIYAVNYNVLRIMSGMGGLAYSN